MGTALLCLFGSLGIRVAFNLSNADPSDIPGFIERLAGLFVIRGMENTESPLSLLAALTLAFSMIIPCTLGFHIRRRFAGSYAMVLPGFHRANIVVLIFICVTCSVILALTALPSGASLSGSCFTISAFIMYTLCLVQFFSVIAIPITIFTLTFFVESQTAEKLFAESFSVHHLIALTIGIAATIVWGMRLSKLKPENYDLRIVRLIPIAHNATALKRLKRCNFQLGLARKLRNLGSYAGDSTWRKARLYSAGRYNLAFGPSVIICVLIVFAIAHFAMDNRVMEIDSKTTHVLATGHVLFALLSGFCVLPFLVIASAPQNPLFNNLTKPCSRKQLIHEVGLSLIIDTLFVWLVLMLAWGAFTLLHTPQTFATSTPYLTALLSLSWMVWIFGTTT